MCSTVIQKLLLNIIPPSFIYFFRSSLLNLTVMRNVWAELPPRPTRAESKSPRLFRPGKVQKWEKPQETERTFPQGFSRYHSWRSAWLWWEEICVIQNNNKLYLETSLKEKGTIVKKKKKAEKSCIRTCICSVYILQFLKSVTGSIKESYRLTRLREYFSLKI